MDTIDLDARAKALAQRQLTVGAHRSLDEGTCPLELAGWLAGEEWTDHPVSVCPVLAAFVRALNDILPQADRTVLLLPLVPCLVGTRANNALEHRRGLMAGDWLIRTNAPAWFRMAGLTREADALSSLAAIDSLAQLRACTLLIRSAADLAKTRRETAWQAEWTIPRNAPRDDFWFDAWETAWAGPYTASQRAAWDPALMTLRDGARDAAAAAIWSRSEIQSPIPDLLRSTLALVERMIETKDENFIAP